MERYRPELGNLGNLTELYLTSNQLDGAIPPELGNLDNLTELYLTSNQLSGAIPPELGSLTNLETLSLSSNQLSGAIPPELGSLTNLEVLNLDSNQLSGAIPPALGKLTNLRRLDLRDNALTGAIPPELNGLLRLEELLLGGSNQWSGCIPNGLRNVAENDLDTLVLPFCTATQQASDSGGAWQYAIRPPDYGTALTTTPEGRTGGDASMIYLEAYTYYAADIDSLRALSAEAPRLTFRCATGTGDMSTDGIAAYIDWGTPLTDIIDAVFFPYADVRLIIDREIITDWEWQWNLPPMT